MSKNHEKILSLRSALETTKDPTVLKLIQDQIALLERTDSDENAQDVPKSTDDKVDSLKPSADFKDYNGAKVFSSDKSKISSGFKKMIEDEEKKKKSRNFFIVDEDKKKTKMPAEIDKFSKDKKPDPLIPPSFNYDETTPISLSKTKVINTVIFDDKKGHYYLYSVSKNVFMRLPDCLGDIELAPRFMSADILNVKDSADKDNEKDKDKDKGKDPKDSKKKDYAGFISMGMKYNPKNYLLEEDEFSVSVSSLRDNMRSVGNANNGVFFSKDMIYAQNSQPLILSPGLGLILGEASSGKTAMIKSFGASTTTIGEPTPDSLPFDRRTFISTIVKQVNNNSISALDSIRLLLLEGDNLVSGGVSIASAAILTALASALARYNKQFIIAVNPSSAKASAAVGDAFLGSVTTVFQLNKYNNAKYDPLKPWMGVNGVVSSRNYSRDYYNFLFREAQ